MNRLMPPESNIVSGTRRSSHVSQLNRDMFLVIALLLIAFSQGERISSSEPCFAKTCSFEDKSLLRVGRERVISGRVRNDFSGFSYECERLR